MAVATSGPVGIELVDERRVTINAKTKEGIRCRTMAEFAEQEVIIPSGKYQDLRFKLDRQPYTRLLYDEIDSGRYTEFVITGPSQSGKSLVGFVIPILYHLFERNETVIAAAPDDDIARDRWNQAIEPVLMRTRFAEYLPTSGKGSKGGSASAIQFRHGPILKWMTAGGSDKSRASFTSRVVCMTETDGFDRRTSTSEEANKIAQIEARVRSYSTMFQRIYKECTLTTKHGHTWERFIAGSGTEIYLRCPHCGGWVLPGRDDLVGWKDAESEKAALDGATFACRICGELWSEEERRAANREARLVHRGQTIDQDGEISGDMPDTLTLGFRWSAVHNLLLTAGDIGLDEWRAARATDEDSEQRRMSQFVWAVPFEPTGVDLDDLTTESVQRRQLGFGRGQVPDGFELVTLGIDINQLVAHWTAIAWKPDKTGHIIDYGKTGVVRKAEVDAAKEQCRIADEPYKALPPEVLDVAIFEALHRLHERIGSTWTKADYHLVLIDARWSTSAVAKAIRRLQDKRWMALMGLGIGQVGSGFHQPKKQTGDKWWLGDGAYEEYLDIHKQRFVIADANHWKTWLHHRLSIGEGDDGGAGRLTLFASIQPEEHFEFARHLTAERQVEKKFPTRGYQKVWEPVRRQNHWLDATYIACVAGHRLNFGNRTAVKPRSSQPMSGSAPVGQPAYTFQNPQWR